VPCKLVKRLPVFGVALPVLLLEKLAIIKQAPAQSLEEEIQVFHHLLEEFCGIKNNHPAYMVLEKDGISTAQNFISMSTEYFQGLT